MSWANNVERGEHGLPNSRVTTFGCEACAEHSRSRIDSENREPPRSTFSSTRSTTKQNLQPVQCGVETNDSGSGQRRVVWIVRDGHQDAVQSMPITLEWRHRLLHMRASLKRNSGQSTFQCVYDGLSFDSRIRNQEGKTSWPQIWETSRKQRISSLLLRMRGEMQLTKKIMPLNDETSDTNDNVKAKIQRNNTKHNMKLNSDLNTWACA